MTAEELIVVIAQSFPYLCCCFQSGLDSPVVPLGAHMAMCASPTFETPMGRPRMPKARFAHPAFVIEALKLLGEAAATHLL